MVNFEEPLQASAPITRPNAFITINSTAEYYAHFVRIFIPNRPMIVMNKNLEGRKDKPVTSVKARLNKETDLERSLRRTRKKIKSYALCNKFDLFATFTFKSDRQNTDLSKSKMSNWLKNQRKRIGPFDYLIVPEFHKDGISLHFHALLVGYKGQLNMSINRKTNKPIVQKGRQIYEFPGYKSGFSNVMKIDDHKDSATKVALYIQKYVTKDMPVFFNRRRYWNSRGLKRPITEIDPEKWFLEIDPNREFMTDYGLIWEFDVGSHPLVDIYHGARWK